MLKVSISFIVTPKSRVPMATDAHSRPLINIYFGVPSKGAP
jgi:hypothetical protein